MGLFNMLESFFFVTLGISCVLLMMLIYHFKQRINKLENNNRLMFDVINNMVQEMSMLKHSIQVGVSSNHEMNVPSQFDYPNNNYEKVDVILDEVENENDDEYESDSESEEWDSNDENSDTSTEVSGPNEEDTTDNIKTIAVELEDGIDESVNDSHDATNEELENMEEVITAVVLDDDESNVIQVNKLEDSINLEESSVDTQSIDKKSVYKKMTVTTLKALVIEKGLNTDPSKLKKNELLQLLESN